MVGFAALRQIAAERSARRQKESTSAAVKPASSCALLLAARGAPPLFVERMIASEQFQAIQRRFENLAAHPVVRIDLSCCRH
jgi:hypothetical protein